MVQEPEGNPQTQKQAGGDLNTQTGAWEITKPKSCVKTNFRGIEFTFASDFTFSPTCILPFLWCNTSMHHLSKPRMVNVSRNLASVQSDPPAQTRKRPGGRDEGEESKPWGEQKRGNQGRGENGTHSLAFKQRISSLYLVFPPLCFHKESLFHTAPSDACSLSFYCYSRYWFAF